MNMDNFEQRNTNDTNTIASAIEFSSLCSAIQHDYEGNNISNIITQLLHMYQPKDGINAYERVLKKVQTLLEEYDFQKKQLLLSIIPSPDNVPDHTIKEVFRTTTGFTKLNLQENNTFQNMFDTETMENVDGRMDNVSSSKQNFLYDLNTSNFKSSFSEAFPFRGFSESEISMIPNHIKKAVSSSHLNDNSKNWLERNNKYQMSSYRQYLLNKKYYVPARINMYNTIPESHSYRSSQTVCQDTRSMKMSNNTEIIADLPQNTIPRQFNNVKYEYKRYKDALDENKSGISHVIIDIDQDATTKQLIKDEIHKMDVCWDGDENIVINADDLLPTANDKLKTSLNNFLKRAQEGIFVESAFPRIRSHPQDFLNLTRFTSKDLKSGTPSKVLGQAFTSNVSNSDSNSCLLLKQQNTNINVEKNQKESIERTKQKVITYDNGLEKKYSSQEFNKITELQLQQKNLDYDMKKKATTLECKDKNTEKSRHGYEMIESKSDNVNSSNSFQARSMFQLAAYKKRYYDTLLNVQRAKVAISNSLTSPSDHLIAYDDPYYSNYMCQQQHLLHQQRHLTKPQFSTYPADLSGLSSTHSDQYNSPKSICKYLLLKQLRQQTSPLYTRNQNGWIHRYVEHAYPYSSMSSGSDQTKYCVRRKNLEDIVEKLKETEHNNLDTNN